jgi:hypothetical protein
MLRQIARKVVFHVKHGANGAELLRTDSIRPGQRHELGFVNQIVWTPTRTPGSCEVLLENPVEGSAIRH